MTPATERAGVATILMLGGPIQQLAMAGVSIAGLASWLRLTTRPWHATVAGRPHDRTALERLRHACRGEAATKVRHDCDT